MASGRSSAVVEKLLARGVLIPVPASVQVAEEVQPERIAAGVVIHAGCRLRGQTLSIGPGSVLGEEAPVTVDACQLGREVHLKGGFCAGSVFLDGAVMGSGAHVRAGCLLEEQANGAHTVGLKQTVLLPFVTTGSLINFCDILMAGGTSRKNHSEVGSSYIHFNFTPRQDKATASLIGDVPRGVLLDQPPIFLGGQGGLVGPVRVEYGCVLPAGAITRQDALERDRLLLPAMGSGAARSIPYDTVCYGAIDRVVGNNLVYIGNIVALEAWYRQVRSSFMSDDPYQQACLDGAERVLDTILNERLRRMADLAGRMRASLEALTDEGPPRAQQACLLETWPAMEKAILRERAGTIDLPAGLGRALRPSASMAYLDFVASLSEDLREQVRAWLQAKVDSIEALWHPSPS